MYNFDTGREGQSPGTITDGKKGKPVFLAKPVVGDALPIRGEVQARFDRFVNDTWHPAIKNGKLVGVGT